MIKVNTFKINVIIENKEYCADVTIEDEVIKILYEDNYLMFNIRDIDALKIENEEILHLVLNRKIIIFKGSNIKQINMLFDDFKSYNNSNIKINSKKKLSLKSPIGICMLYTIIYLIIYRALIGLSLYQYWGVSDFSAIIGTILGGAGDDYPTDGLEIFAFILLVIEIIGFIILRNKKIKDNVLILESSFNNTLEQESEIDKLSKLKELLDKNVITQEDFDKKKEEILKKI